MILCYIIIYYTILCFLVLHYIYIIHKYEWKSIGPFGITIPSINVLPTGQILYGFGFSKRKIHRQIMAKLYIICCNLYTHSCSAYYFVHSTQYHRIESSQTLACYSSHLILSCLPDIHYLYLFVLCYLPVHQSMHACMPPRSGVGMHLKLHLWKQKVHQCPVPHLQLLERKTC